ncbi:hypothetical protein SY88_12415 [Clostridiales bacterium PH28_bin88]|nr:hypothetical protein SY88_12415 [Clostridiales bacterium PH28_bin88]
MKLATFEIPGMAGPVRRIGVVVREGVLADLNAATACYLSTKGHPRLCNELADALVPADMLRFLDGEEESMAAARDAYQFALDKVEEMELQSPRGQQVYYSLDIVKLKAPIPRPCKVIETGSNFDEHVNELNTVKVEGWSDFKDFMKKVKQPSGFLKAANTVIGHKEDIIYPRTTQKLDHEIELGIVIGKRGRYIPVEKAFEHIVGYTVHNDVSARDIQVNEQANRLVLLGKSMDTFCPLGPFLVTRDEVPDPDNLDMKLTVNGDVRQDSNTNHMIFKVAQLVSWWSQLTLEPGDVITSATPGGVAGFRYPDPTPFFLKPGDIVEAWIQHVGCLQNRVVSEEEA